jgi:hypothetical protein
LELKGNRVNAWILWGLSATSTGDKKPDLQFVINHTNYRSGKKHPVIFLIPGSLAGIGNFVFDHLADAHSEYN